MGTCYRCGAPTQTRNIELPICLVCSDALDPKSKSVPNEEENLSRSSSYSVM
jgi:hypothetical protein